MEPEDLLDEFLGELDARRTLYDRAALWLLAGFLWLGIAAMAAQTWAKHRGTKLDTELPAALVRLAHTSGVLEAAAYLLALSVAAQGCRKELDGSNCWWLSLAGGLAFAPCWCYSTVLHAAHGAGGRRRWSLAVGVGLALQAVLLAPLALVHGCRLSGALSVASAYLALVLGLCGARDHSWPLLGKVESPRTGAACAAAAAALLGVLAAALPRLVPALGPRLRPFAVGAACCGHVAYMVAALLVASRWHCRAESYVGRQVLVLASSAAMLLPGWLLPAPALIGTGLTFLLLWLLQKELEAQWSGTWAKLAMAALLLQCLYARSDQVMAMFDPAGLYVL